MQSDRERWDARWEEKAAAEPAPPEPWIVAQGGELPPGPVLDVAAGEGRHALWLAAAGRAVTAVDVSPVGLARLRDLAAARGLAVETVVADLDEPGSLAGLGPFAGLLVVRYKPGPEQWQRLARLLEPGGRALVCSFGRFHHARTGFPLAFCLDEAELRATLEPLLRCLCYERFERDGESLEGSLWERPPA